MLTLVAALFYLKNINNNISSNNSTQAYNFIKVFINTLIFTS